MESAGSKRLKSSVTSGAALRTELDILGTLGQVSMIVGVSLHGSVNVAVKEKVWTLLGNSSAVIVIVTVCVPIWVKN